MKLRFLEKLKPKIRTELVSELVDKVLECIDTGRDTQKVAELMEEMVFRIGESS